MKLSRSEWLTITAFALSFLIAILGLITPLALLYGEERALLKEGGSLDSQVKAPISLSQNESLLPEVVLPGNDSYLDLLGRLSVWSKSEEKTVREAYSYELSMDVIAKMTQAALESLRESGALPAFAELPPIFDARLSSNYIETFGAFEIEEQHKYIEVEGIKLPYDLGRWSLIWQSEEGYFITVEADAQTGRIFSVDMFLPEGEYDFSPGTALVMFAKYHGILESSYNVSYDTASQCLFCEEIVLSCDYKESADGVDIRIRAMTAEDYAGSISVETEKP
ncbi:MAG: hypothetical protein IKM38_01560 [Christensenellaceae bacterium]|nr:hypothetical protein [Christensenellaceae bacterium]